MPVGLIISKWDNKVGIKTLGKYPEEVKLTDKSLLQVTSTHEYTGESGMINLLAGSLNIASYYTGADVGIYIILLLNLDDDADAYEGILSDVARVVIQNLEDRAYLDMLPTFFQRISAYPSFNEEQILAFMYQDEVNRVIINQLREEGVITKSELKVWLKDQYKSSLVDMDSVIFGLIRKEILKEVTVKGLPSELIFLINDLVIMRRPPINLLKNPLEKGLPERFIKDYPVEVKKFFKDYSPSEEDNLKLLDIMINPQVYEVLKLLRIAIATKNVLAKLKKKGVDDIDGVLKILWENKIIHIFQDSKGSEYYALISDFYLKLIFPKYILQTIINQYGVKSKANKVLIEYLNILEDIYYELKEDKRKKKTGEV